MKRSKTVPASLIAAALGSVLLSTSATAAEKLTYGTFLPPENAVLRLDVSTFADEVERQTNGEITFEIIAGGTLLGISDTVKGIGEGTADAGFVLPQFAVDALPHVSLMPELGSLASDVKQATGATNETLLLHCPECVEDYANMNTVHFGGNAPAPYWLQCAQRVQSFADLRNKRIRVAAANSARWAEAFGGVPVKAPLTEIPELMRRGEVDCAFAFPTWLQEIPGLQDEVRHVIAYPQGVPAGVGTFVFNREVWARLSEDQKQVFLRAIAKALAFGTIQAAYVEQPKGALDLAQTKGITVVESDPEFERAWQAYVEGEAEAVVADAVGRGVAEAVARRIVETHLANLEKWAKISEEIELDEAKFEQALWEHIYRHLKM